MSAWGDLAGWGDKWQSEVYGIYKCFLGIPRINGGAGQPCRSPDFP